MVAREWNRNLNKLLTIIIPTYNRSEFLSALLSRLVLELEGCKSVVDVIVGNNASSDNTSAVIHEFSSRWASTQTLEHKENLGAEENFCRCVENVNTPYFWIIGDDDSPCLGVIELLLDFLYCYQPDLVYLSSQWSSKVNVEAHNLRIAGLEATLMDKRSFGRQVNVWMTFISGLIVKRELIDTSLLRQFKGSQLVQLGWVFSALRNGRRFLYVHTSCVQAQSGNTGGYNLLRVFGRNFQHITRRMLSDDANQRAMADEIIRRTTISFLPGLVWGFRQGNLGEFGSSVSFDGLDYELRRSLPFRLLVNPLAMAAPRQATALIFLARCLTKLIKTYDFGYARLLGECKKVRLVCK